MNSLSVVVFSAVTLEVLWFFFAYILVSVMFDFLSLDFGVFTLYSRVWIQRVSVSVESFFSDVVRDFLTTTERLKLDGN